MFLDDVVSGFSQTEVSVSTMLVILSFVCILFFVLFFRFQGLYFVLFFSSVLFVCFSFLLLFFFSFFFFNVFFETNKGGK